MMMYSKRLTNSYKKDLRRVAKQGKDISLLEHIVDTLADGKPLDPKYKDHNLHGDYVSCRECHIQPDWLLVYRIDKGELELILLHTDTHSNLF
jgi:mRNA interferase YafQ